MHLRLDLLILAGNGLGPNRDGFKCQILHCVLGHAVKFERVSSARRRETGTCNTSAENFGLLVDTYPS